MKWFSIGKTNVAQACAAVRRARSCLLHVIDDPTDPMQRVASEAFACTAGILAELERVQYRMEYPKQDDGETIPGTVTVRATGTGQP